MPEISRFLGIVITMNWDDNEPPNFHASYGDYEITVNIHTGLVEGKFPKRGLRYVLDWYDLNQEELIQNWQYCQNKQAVIPIEPLE